MVTASWFLSATEARNNIVKCIAVHSEISAIEDQVLLAIQQGYYQTTVSGGTLMTNSTTNSSRTFTVNPSSNILTIINHNFSTGDAVLVSSTGELPPPLLALTYYYAIFVDSNSIRLATSVANAQAGQAISIDIDAGVSAVSLDNVGSGYLTAPTVSFTGGTPTDVAQARAVLETFGNVYSVSMQTLGSGFVAAPSVAINAAGSGASAGTVLFKLVSASVSFGGSGFNVGDELLTLFGNQTGVLKVISVSGGSVTGVQITTAGVFTQAQLPVPLTGVLMNNTGTGSGCSLNLVMGIASIAVASAGLNYVNAPLVTITGGAGSQATARAILVGGTVSSFLITNPGTGYTGTPTVNITSGSGATAVAVLTPSDVSAIYLQNPGSAVGNPPSVQLTTPGSGATVGTITLQVVLAQVNNRGIGYTLGDSLLVSGGAGLSNCTIQVTEIDANGTIRGFNITARGSYTSLPVLTANNAYGGTGAGASFDLVFGINTVSVQTSGSGYPVPPLVIFSGGNGSGAQAQTVLSGTAVQSVEVTSPGTGYTSVPTAVFTLGSGATAQAHLIPSALDNLYIVSGQGGSGYNDLSPPSVTITGGGGQGATGSVQVTGGVVTSISLTNAGSGYTSLPTVVIDPPVSGTQAQALAGMLTYIDHVTVLNSGSNYIIAPTVEFAYGGAQAYSLLEPTSVASIRVLTGGSNYTANPTLSYTAAPQQVDLPTYPIASVNRSFSVNSIVVTNSGSGYDLTPTVALSAPASGGTQSLATATLGYGTGIFTIQEINASVDYYQVWSNCAASNTLLVRPYQDQIAAVIKYFTDLGYVISQSVNPATGNTFVWTIKW